MAKKKTWREKLDAPQERRVVDDARRGGTLLIPRPTDVDVIAEKATTKFCGLDTQSTC